jgi:hypothetical protein
MTWSIKNGENKLKEGFTEKLLLRKSGGKVSLTVFKEEYL